MHIAISQCVIQELARSVERASDTILGLRKCLKGFSLKSTTLNFSLLRLSKRRKNAIATHKLLKTLASVQQAQSTIQVMISGADPLGALELIATTQDVLRTELRGLACVRSLSHQLADMQDGILSSIETDVVATLNQQTPPFVGCHYFVHFNGYAECRMMISLMN